jgi:hypothetical protein
MRGQYRSWRTGAANANLENAETWKILVTRVKTNSVAGVCPAMIGNLGDWFDISI